MTPAGARRRVRVAGGRRAAALRVSFRRRGESWEGAPRSQTAPPPLARSLAAASPPPTPHTTHTNGRGRRGSSASLRAALRDTARPQDEQLVRRPPGSGGAAAARAHAAAAAQRSTARSTARGSRRSASTHPDARPLVIARPGRLDRHRLGRRRALPASGARAAGGACHQKADGPAGCRRLRPRS